MRYPHVRYAVATLATLVLTGCMVGPDFRTPDTTLDDNWVEAAEFGVRRDAAVDVRWWETFNDPVLVKLVDEAYRSNLDLRTAGVRVLQAMAQRGVAQGQFWPQSQTIDASASRSRASDNFAPEGGPTPPPDNYWNTYSSGFYASWELDFFGKFRRNIEAANAELDATLAGYDDVMVSLIAEVGQAWAQAPQETHSESSKDWSSPLMMRALKPRPCMLRTNWPWISSQARTQREQLMHFERSDVM